MRQITPQCASCVHYDGLADRCANPRLGCERRAAPKAPQNERPYKDPCRGCRYLDAHSGDCRYDGLGCVRWKENRNG